VLLTIFFAGLTFLGFINLIFFINRTYINKNNYLGW